MEDIKFLMEKEVKTVGEAQLVLAEWNSKAMALNETDAFVHLSSQSLPLEITTRLTELWGVTKKIAGQIIYIGRIIILKVIEFIKQHPHAVIGMVLGAAIGALVSLIPWIGPLLAPLAATIGAVYGFMQGSQLDHPNANTPFQGLIITAKEFFAMIANLFNLLKDKLIAQFA